MDKCNFLIVIFEVWILCILEIWLEFGENNYCLIFELIYDLIIN